MLVCFDETRGSFSHKDTRSAQLGQVYSGDTHNARRNQNGRFPARAKYVPAKAT